MSHVKPVYYSSSSLLYQAGITIVRLKQSHPRLSTPNSPTTSFPALAPIYSGELGKLAQGAWENREESERKNSGIIPENSLGTSSMIRTLLRPQS